MHEEWDLFEPKGSQVKHEGGPLTTQDTGFKHDLS